jgi:5'-3' exonuclease
MIIEASRILIRIRNEDIVSPNRISRFAKGASAEMNLLRLTQRDLRVVHAAALTKRAQKKLAGTVVQKREVVTVKDVRGNHIARTQEEVERKKNRQKRAETIRQNKLFRHEKAIAKRFELVGKKAEV